MSPQTRSSRPDAAPPWPDDSSRHPWLLGLLLAVLTAGIVLALVTSKSSGTGALDVGDSGARSGEPARAPDSQLPASPPAPRRSCEPTRSNPGGDNNYIPQAPELDTLGEGFVITGLVRSASGCRPLAGVPIQIWLATETGDETQNRATVHTGRDGRYRIQTAPTVPQFGEPNIHVAYDAGRFGPVFIRRVVDLDDSRAVVDLTLAR